MAEKIDFKIGHYHNLQSAVTLTLDHFIWHTHVSLINLYIIPNFVEIGNIYVKSEIFMWTNGLRLALIGRIRRVDMKNSNK